MAEAPPHCSPIGRELKAPTDSCHLIGSGREIPLDDGIDGLRQSLFYPWLRQRSIGSDETIPADADFQLRNFTGGMNGQRAGNRSWSRRSSASWIGSGFRTNGAHADYQC
jgi:hypothetical protein